MKYVAIAHFQSKLSGTSLEVLKGVKGTVPLCLSTALPINVPGTTHKQACVICAESFSRAVAVTWGHSALQETLGHIKRQCLLITARDGSCWHLVGLPTYPGEPPEAQHHGQHHRGAP